MSSWAAVSARTARLAARAVVPGLAWSKAPTTSISGSGPPARRLVSRTCEEEKKRARWISDPLLFWLRNRRVNITETSSKSLR